MGLVFSSSATFLFLPGYFLGLNLVRRRRRLRRLLASLVIKPQDTPSRFRSKNATYIAHSGTNYKMGPDFLYIKSHHRTSATEHL